MRRIWNAADLKALMPEITDGEAADLLARLNKPTTPISERWNDETAGMVRTLKAPPLPLGQDGLTAAERTVNAFADAQGLPIPFPPHPEPSGEK